jgi:hypothetical protein
MTVEYEPLVGERLQAALARVLETVPFYAGKSPESLPLLRREDLAGVAPARWVPADFDVSAELSRGTVRMMTTSGSTDEPLRIVADGLHPLPPNVWAMHGLDEPVKLVTLTAPICLGTHCPGDIAPDGEHGLLLTFRKGLFTASDEAVGRAGEAWNQLQPDVAFANPVWLHWLARRAAGLGLSLHQPKVLALTYQYVSQCQRRGLRRYFSAPQVEFYGASEFAGVDLAIGCDAGHLHVVDYQVFAEAVPCDEVPGHDELFFSTPTSRTMPLLRYSPGDLGGLFEVDEGDCALWHAPVVQLEGRVAHVMHSERPVTTREADEALSVEGLEFYTARARAGALHLDCVGDPACRGALETAGRALGFSATLVTFVERLELGPSGKLTLTQDDDRHALELR